MAHRHSAYSKGYERRIPVYDPHRHTAWTFEMRQYLRTEEPLGSQICEEEIKEPELSLINKKHAAAETAKGSLALTRSNSYTLTDGSGLQSLFGGAPSDEDSDQYGSAGLRREDSDATLTYDPPAVTPQPDRAPSSGAPRTPAKSRTRDGDSQEESRKATARPAVAVRRSARLRAGETGAQTEAPADKGTDEPDAEGKQAGADPHGEAAAAQADKQDDEEEDSESRSGTGDDDVPPSSSGADDGSGGGGPGDRRHRSEQRQAQRIARLEHRLTQLGERKRTEESKMKSLVERAKAVRTLLRQTIDPRVWESLPVGIRREAFNQANAKVWGIIQASLGYSHHHLLGQLSEGDGRGAWKRLVHLHAEETNGAQAHYLQELISCSYKRTAGTDGIGHIRRYADQLQRINQLYKLSSGGFVQPCILMTRLLALPAGYDTIVEHIEMINSTRAANSDPRGNLDFHEVVAKIAMYENRAKRRRRQGRDQGAPPPRAGRSWSRNRHTRNRGHAYAAEAKGGRKHNELCYRCGKPGHYARECREDVSGAQGAARGSQTAQMPKANLARYKPGSKRFSGRGRGSRGRKGSGRGAPRRKPAVGFLAVEEPGQAMVAIGKPAQADRVIIDSGASGSFCVEGTSLSNAKATRRIISSAGSQQLVGRAVGDWGCLKRTVALQGLRTGLASVSQITEDYQALLVFTPKEVFAIPKADLEGILQKKYKIGKRDATGLYIGHVWDMTEVLTTEKGFQKPITSPVGATMTALERHAAEGRQVHYALAVRQRSQAHTRRHPIPRRVEDLSGQLREGEGRQRRRDPGRVGDVYPSKRMTVGKFPLLLPPTRITSTAQGAPEYVRFIDVCCGIGSFASAGILAGWKPVASIDYCKTVANGFHWNYSHPFVKADICKWKERDRLERTFKNIDVCLFSPPCQPYSTAGLERPGDERAKVAEAGLELVLGWKPSLIVIKCAASTSHPEASPVFKELVLPRLYKAGYDVYVAHGDVFGSGMRVPYGRAFIVATNYPRGDALERHMGALDHQRSTIPAQTSGFPPLDQITCEPRHEDAERIEDTAELTRDRQLALGLVLAGPLWLRRALGILTRCGIERHLRGEDPVGATKQAATNACEDSCQGIDARTLARTNARFLSGYKGGRILPAHGGNAGPHRVGQGIHMGERPQGTATKPAWALNSSRPTDKITPKKARRNGNTPDSEGIRPNQEDSMPPRNGLARAMLVNLVIHTDTIHQAVPSMGNKHAGVQVFVDECTRYAWVETYESQSHADFSRMLKRAEHRIRSQHMESKEYSDRQMVGQGRPVIHYFSDRTSEIVNAQHRARLARIFTSEDCYGPVAGTSNGLAKQAARSMLNISTSLMVDAELPHILWADAFKMAASIYNTKRHSANHGKSPYEMYYGKPPGDVVRKRFPGRGRPTRRARGGRPKRRKKRSKLRASSRPYVYMGTSPGGKPGHLASDPPTHKGRRTKDHARTERSAHKDGAGRSPPDRAAPEYKKGTSASGSTNDPSATRRDTWDHTPRSQKECAKHLSAYWNIIITALDGVAECMATLAPAADQGFPTGKIKPVTPMVPDKHKDLGSAEVNLLSEVCEAEPIHLGPSTGLNVPANPALAYSAAQETVRSDKFRLDTSKFAAAYCGALKWVSWCLQGISNLCPHRSSESMESKHSVSLLNAQPTSNHKGSNDTMASANDDQPRVGRLPYGAAGPDCWDHRPEVLTCPACDSLCLARHVPSRHYALEHEGECESEVWARLGWTPPRPGEWELKTKIIDLMDLAFGELLRVYEDGEYYIGTARTHLDLIVQILDHTGAGELTIKDMFDRRRESGYPRQHEVDCEHADHDEPYAEEAPQQEVVPQEEAPQQGEAPRDEGSPEGGRPPKRARTGEAASAAEATTEGSGK